MSDVLAVPKLDWQPFRCEVIPERAAVRVKPIGELDLATVGQVARPLEELREAGFRKLVLDLTEVTFIDSSGMRLVLRTREAALRDGVSFVVLPGPPAVQRSFELTGLGGLISA